MASRSQIYKIIAIVILFLVFLQYLYLFPVKLNLGFSSSNSNNNHVIISNNQLSSTFDLLHKNEKSLFNFKTASTSTSSTSASALNKKRSSDLGDDDDETFSSIEEETQEKGNSESANTNNAKNNNEKNVFQTQRNHSRLKLVSTLSSSLDRKPSSNHLYSSSSYSSISSAPQRISFSASSLSSIKPTLLKSQQLIIHNKLHNNESNERYKSSSSPPPPQNNSSSTQFCSSEPPTLLGYLKVALNQPPSLADIGRSHDDIALGGRYKPPNCISKDKVAIVVPFRDREEHLRLFLVNILPFLKRQQIEFNIFVIEQGSTNKDEPFNRAMLFNVGFVEGNKRGKFDCFIFHDVDLIPENDYNLYNCPVQPRHMSVAVDKMGYKLPYRNLFGGISALTREHFQRVNGFSNSFWGWGAEDDDMAGRIAYNGLYISRPSPNIARYKMLKHKQQKLNNQRYRVLQKGKTRFRSDGLSNLKYVVEQITLEKTYTLVRVKLGKP